MFRWISKSKLEKVIALMFLVWGWTLFWPLVTTIQWVEKYDQWGEPMQTLRAYHPLSHIHKFVFGMCAARCFVEIFCRAKKENPNGRLFISETQINRVAEARFAAPLGWFGIICLFGFRDKDAFQFPIPWLGRLAAQDLFLLPLSTMVIVGAAIRRDPITKVMNMPPFSWIGNLEISYEIYILQGPVMTFMSKLFTAKWMLPNPPPKNGELSDDELLQNEEHWVALVRWLYLPCLIFVAWFVNRYATKPIAVFMSTKEKPAAKPAAAASSSA